MYPEDWQPTSYSDEELKKIEDSRKNHPEPQHHRHARLVLILLFVLLITLVSGLSYLLTKKDKTDSEDNSQQVSTVENAQTTEGNKAVGQRISQNWFEFKSNEYDIKIPDGWDMVHQDNGVLLMSCDSLPNCYQLHTGTLGTVTETIGGRDGLQGFLFVIQPEGYSIPDYTADYTFDKEIANGYSLYIREVTEEGDNQTIGGDLPVGTKEFLALKVLEDNRISYFSYSVVPTQTNPTDIIEEMIVTLAIK